MSKPGPKSPTTKIQSPSGEGRLGRGTHRVIIELVSPSGPGVIDQDMKGLLLGRNLVHELVDVGEVLHVGCDRDAFSRTKGVEFYGGFFAVFGRSGRDVNL